MRSLHRQRGFIYLTTGANGSGKTLFTLRDVRKLQVETSRPVFYAGFTPKEPLSEFGWREFDPEKWQDLPDGSICIVDECQKWMPARGVGKPPEWIGAILEVHRKRGFDFFLISQHPLNIDAFIRRAVASPGWHRHMKASFMGDTSNELRWTSVVTQPERPNSGASGFVTKRPFDKEVYGWYESASVHTAKKKIPFKLIAAIGGMVAAVCMFGYVAWGFYAQAKGEGIPSAKPAQQGQSGQSTAAASVAAPARSAEARAPLTPVEYAARYVPRVDGLQHSAPAYDQLTAIRHVPRPAACVESISQGCKCWTQQATPYATTQAICRQIVATGIFIDFDDQASQRERQEQRPKGQGPSHLVAGDNRGPQSAE